MANVTLTWRPLNQWPAGRKPTASFNRQSGSQFKASIAGTMGELEDELRMISATEAVCEIDCDAKDLRLNGEPRAATLTRGTPGIVLHFINAEGNSVTMPCDKFQTWQANLRGLMLTLRALRAVDRYGATASGEQYRGWMALPGAGATTPTLSTQQAAELLSTWSGNPTHTADAIKASIDTARASYRLAMSRSHPDKTAATGGSNQKFTLVQEAGRILGAHHGGKL